MFRRPADAVFNHQRALSGLHQTVLCAFYLAAGNSDAVTAGKPELTACGNVRAVRRLFRGGPVFTGAAADTAPGGDILRMPLMLCRRLRTDGEIITGVDDQILSGVYLYRLSPDVMTGIQSQIAACGQFRFHQLLF